MDASDIYTHGHQEAVLRSHRWRTAENSAAYLLPHLHPDLHLLDVGCGPGTLTLDLARRVAPGAVIAVDVAPNVVAEAASAAADEGLANVTFRTGDFRTLDFGRSQFDVVHAHQVLQHLRDPVGALAAMRRLVKPGGLIAVRESDYSAMTWAPADPLLDRWREVYMEVTRRNGAQADAGRYLLGWAHAASLTDVVYTTSTWTFANSSDRMWWANMWAERTRHSSLAEQASDYGIATASELGHLADGWQAWARHADAVFTVLHGEIIVRC